MTVVGGGFIGSELAASLSGAGVTVSMVVPEPGSARGCCPPALADFVTGYYRDKGVEVLTGETVAVGRRGHGHHRLRSRARRATPSWRVSGIVPNTELADAAGLPVDNGIVVDAEGRVEGDDDVFAAGDVANFPMRRARAEAPRRARGSREHARPRRRREHGRRGQPYDHLPFFYSDLFDLGYEAVGELDSRARDGRALARAEPQGVVAYVDDDGRPRGFLLWNVWDKVDAARELIRARRARRRGRACLWLVRSRGRGRRAHGRTCSRERVFRPLAHVVVLALLPLRVPPPAVVLASAGERDRRRGRARARAT